jgi:hypothetical protein
MMGQQQLLLIVLGIIVVGLTIFVGMSLAATYSEDANREAVGSDLITLTSLARAHYFRPQALGGGGYSFANFIIPAEFDTNANGTYEIFNEGHKSDHIHIRGTGTAVGEDGVNPIMVEVRYSLTESRFTKKN